MSASLVEYDGFLTSGAATLSPAVRFDTTSLSIGGQGSWTVFESGNQIFQASAAAAWLTPSHGRWRMELSGAAGASRYADQPGSAHILARARFHFFADRQGGWFSGTTGSSSGFGAAPLELGIGGWTVRQRLAVVGAVTGTWLGDDRHVDVSGAARWTASRVELEARVGARPWAASDGLPGDARTGVWGELSALVPVGSRISLALSGGRYPSDPLRRVLGARYITAGLQLAFAGADRSPALTIPAAVAAVRTHANMDGTPAVRLEIVPAGQQYALLVHAAGATSVELMGDFSDWLTQPLTRTGDGVWEVRLQLEPGVHRLNIRINGGPWLVPAGARPEEDEFGGVVGIVVVH